LENDNTGFNRIGISLGIHNKNTRKRVRYQSQIHFGYNYKVGKLERIKGAGGYQDYQTNDIERTFVERNSKGIE